MHVEIIESNVRLAELEDQWTAVAASNRSIVSSWQWSSLWWQHLGQHHPSNRLAVLAAWNAPGHLAGIFPLYLQNMGHGSKRLRFLSCSEIPGESLYPEYLDVLCQPGYETPVLTAFRQALLGQAATGWSSLSLERYPGSGLTRRFLEHRFRLIRRAPPLSAPYADLSAGFEQFLATRPSNTRSRFRRLLRDTEKCRSEFEIATTQQQAEQYFDELVLLHQARWESAGQPGAFASERVRGFHRALIHDLLPQNRVVISRLSDGSGPIAVLYGFVSGDIFEFYQSGVRADEAGIKSPGIVAHLLTMRHLSSRGVRMYDFLAGQSDYKDRFASGTRSLETATIWRPSLAALAEVGAGAHRFLSSFGGHRVFSSSS